MGIIKWWNDWKRKQLESEAIDTSAVQSIFDPNFKKFVQRPPDVGLSDEDRIVNYVADGGEVVDLSNKPRLPYDGFASDGELMQPFNQAHTGTKAGLSSLMKGKR
jgi:hypothetical protein